MLQHKPVELLDLVLTPLANPNTGSERLAGTCLARPRKYFPQQGEAEVSFILRLMCSIRCQISVTRLIKKVPDVNARIFCKVAHYAFNISFQAVMSFKIFQDFKPWTLKPSGIVHPNLIFPFSFFRKRIPDAVK